MIRRLVQSAFQTGYLSVESEGLIRQVLDIRGYQPSDLTALQDLRQAVCNGRIKREANSITELFLLPDVLLPEKSSYSEAR
ncbi:hypothetical protein C7B61_15160 [filamentous cyanobacterium CCP1]|nr:hypothetical protein C7B76_19925 [filamentous cyanobacterium CCP2]PSB61977.1 hypothetical protein C7B61_15160 [filamentous cyanobacterium CCP1]